MNYLIMHARSSEPRPLCRNKYNLHRVSETGNTKLTAVTLLIILNRFSNFFHSRFSDKFAANYFSKISPHLECVATLPCETLTSENERQSQTNVVISDKLQGSVATYLRCGGIVNNQILSSLFVVARRTKCTRRHSCCCEW